MPRLTTTILILALVTGCSSSSNWSDQDISDASSTWVNFLGLNHVDPDVWTHRLDEICATEANNLDLAEQYIAEDAEYSLRGDGSVPTPEEAEQAVEIIGLQTCES